MHKATIECGLMVKDGKIYCTIHSDVVEEESWSLHRDSNSSSEIVNGLGLDFYNQTQHKIVTLPMKHVLYTASYCVTCNTGKVLIDEEQ